MSLRSRLQRFLREEHGQVLPVVGLTIVGLLGIGGMVIDVGHLYISHNELQASTNAAALAGAQQLPGDNAVAVATQYSGVAGSLNAQPNLPGVAMVSGYPEVYCLSSLQSAQPCVTSSGGSGGGNVMVVKQQVAVPLFFASLFGFKSFTLTAVAAASMRGGDIPPYNVAIIVDGTGSMSDSDSNCPGVKNATRNSCALAGVRMLLNELYPCASSTSSCIADDNVSLFQFPNVTTASVGVESNCSGSKPSPEPYTFPTAGDIGYSAIKPTSSSTRTTYTAATYQVVGFANDYRTSDASTTLNTASALVKAAGGGGSSCSSMTNPGGEGTYLAGVMYAAQAALVYEKQNLSNPSAQNVIILLTDGAATTSSGDMSTTSEAGTAVSTAKTGTNVGLYPSSVNECQQTVDAAAYAKQNGTRVYTVAYGAATSGCTTDTVSNTSIAPHGAQPSPCAELQNSASSPLTFFSDYTGGGGCLSTARPATDLNTIFTQIGGDFSTSRLIPIPTGS